MTDDPFSTVKILEERWLGELSNVLAAIDAISRHGRRPLDPFMLDLLTDAILAEPNSDEPEGELMNGYSARTGKKMLAGSHNTFQAIAPVIKAVRRSFTDPMSSH